MGEGVIFVFRKWKFCGGGGFTLNSLHGQGMNKVHVHLFSGTLQY